MHAMMYNIIPVIKLKEIEKMEVLILYNISLFIVYHNLGRRRSSSQAPCCPICGTSIRPGEMESHFAWEMERFREENRFVDSHNNAFIYACASQVELYSA